MEPESTEPRRFPERLRLSLAKGGFSRLRAVLWPDDLPQPALMPSGAPLMRLPPLIHPDFFQPMPSPTEEAGALNLPDGYVLYHGPQDDDSIRRVLNAWSWSAGSIGEYYPLLLLGLDNAAQSRAQALCTAYQLNEVVRLLPVVAPNTIPAIYRKSSVVFHPAQVSAWGGSLRLALASGRPVVAADNPLADAIIGDAGYLSLAEDSRTQGAALITVLIEEQFAEQLKQAARSRAGGWENANYKDRLFQTYQAILA